jgi:hypothetical protein
MRTCTKEQARPAVQKQGAARGLVQARVRERGKRKTREYVVESVQSTLSARSQQGSSQLYVLHNVESARTSAKVRRDCCRASFVLLRIEFYVNIYIE